MHQRDRRLLALADAGRAFASCQRLEELLPLAADLALEVLAASSASVGRIEHERGRLRVLHNAGHLAEWEGRTPADETYDVADFPLLAATIESAAPWFGDLGDPETGIHHHELLRQMGMYSLISLPVIVGSTVWGELGAARLEQRSRFRAGDVAAGEALSGLLAASITRIEERDTLQALAYLDALTGLGNRRAIDERLERVFARVTLPRRLAVILGDVDGLKRINDTFGHEAGDRVLREVASMLTRVAGSYPDSLAVRLGGDEFCLLLEGVDDTEVQAVSDRLAEAAHALPMDAGLSCGWTSTGSRPGDARTASAAARAVLRLADAAQYRTKRARRDAPVGLATREPGDLTATRQQIVDSALPVLRAEGASVEERLQGLAVLMTAAANASGWAVSRTDDGLGLVIVANDDAQRSGRRDDQQVTPGVSFTLETYPATVAALAGGSFHATIDRGDDAERAFLAAYGYDEVIGAGSPGPGRTAGLVEVVGDAFTPPLGHLAPLLQALVTLAVEVGSQPPDVTARTDGLSSTRNGDVGSSA